MIYCSFSEGDVHLTRSDKAKWTCLSCKLDPKKVNITFNSLFDVEHHLESHDIAGHETPRQASIKLIGDINEEIENNPTLKNIEAGIQLFFSDKIIFNLDLFFLCPVNNWEDSFLTCLESYDFLSFSECIFITIFLSVAHRFKDSIRVLLILHSWKIEIQKLIHDGYKLEPLEPEEILFGKIFTSSFRSHDLEAWLQKIKDVINKVSSTQIEKRSHLHFTA